MVSVSGFGNILLDISIKTSDDELVSKYHLEDDGQTLTTEVGFQTLLNDIDSKYISPGGCVQNTLRVMQWLLQDSGKTYMFGGIGCDKQGQELRNMVQMAGVNTKYTENKDFSTGTIIAITNGSKRTLTGFLGAAEHYSIANLLEAEALSTILQSRFTYMESFFIPKRNDVAQHVIKYCIDNKKMFVFNLNGTSMFTREVEDMLYFSKNCNILFGNQQEYLRLGQSMHLGDNTHEIALNLCNASINVDSEYNKMVIVTNGAEKVFCAHSKSTIDEIEVPTVPLDEIGDTTGAGDAFVAGFLFALLHDKKPTIALKWGCWAAKQIIKQTGCTIPSYLPDEILSIE